jgi:plastocyanin
MKYLFLSLAALLFVSVGCADNRTTVETIDDTTTARTADGIEIEFTTTGGAITQEVKETVIVPKNDEIPIIDVVLGGQSDVVVQMEASNYVFNPSVINANTGDKIVIYFDKVSGFHTFTIDKLNINFPIEQGESLTFNAPAEPGEYIYYCDIGSSREMGMEGKLVVE